MDLFSMNKKKSGIFSLLVYVKKGMSSTDSHSSYVINYVVRGNKVFQLLTSLNRDGGNQNWTLGCLCPLLRLKF